MNLNKLKDNNGANKKRKRVGRGIGSGTGKTSGKGHKGQKSRSGVAIKGFEGGQMPIHRRLPKRGFNNINREKCIELNFDKIENLINSKIIDPKNTISLKILSDIGIIKSNKSKIKLLAKGTIKNKIKIEVSAASVSAKEIVEKNGGSVTIVSNKNSIKKATEKVKVN